MLSDKEQLRDISSIGLKTVIGELPPASSGKTTCFPCVTLLMQLFPEYSTTVFFPLYHVLKGQRMYSAIFTCFPAPSCLLSLFLFALGSALAASVCKKITGRLTSAIAKQEDVSVQLEALDIMADMLCRYVGWAMWWLLLLFRPLVLLSAHGFLPGNFWKCLCTCISPLWQFSVIFFLSSLSWIYF